MQRFACLLIGITAACSGGTDTGPGSLSGIQPAPMSSSARTFSGADADGNMVMGWKIELFDKAPGADCLSADTKVLASIGIYTNQAAGSKPEAILPTGGISIVTQSPPSLQASAMAATMSAMGVSGIVGLITINEFHLTPDAMHTDRIKGDISAGGKDGSGADVLLNGSFEAPICKEQ